MQNEIDSEDTPLIKLFEFLVASMCLFLIGEGDPISPTTQDVSLHAGLLGTCLHHGEHVMQGTGLAAGSQCCTLPSAPLTLADDQSTARLVAI